VESPEARFEQLFREHYRDVYRYVARRVQHDAAQEVVAEVFVTAWRRHEELRGDPLPWLLGVARRTAGNHLRGESRRSALSTRLAAEHRAFRDDADERDPQLALALATLPERDREALMLIAWDGLEHRVAASVMGCSATAFTVRVHRARRRLRRALGTDDTTAIDLTPQARSVQ
jgi:RNA polymerase sigma-70 factor (ECF subfamily)